MFNRDSFSKAVQDSNARAKDHEFAEKLGSKVLKLNESDKFQFNINIRKDLYSHDAPRTPEELHQYFRVIHNIEIPLTSTNPKFNAPFEWVWHSWKGTYPTMLTIAPRGGSKTFYAAAIANAKGRFFTNYETISAGALKKHSGYSQKYLANFSKDPILKQGFVGKVAATHAMWKSNSSWDIVTATMEGVSGGHPNQLNLDELEFWKRKAIEQTWAVPVEKNGYPSIWNGFSTRQRNSSTMTELVEEAEQAKSSIKLFQWSCFETMRRCHVGGIPTCHAIAAYPDYRGSATDVLRQTVCGLWEDCGGTYGLKSSGWMTREFLIKQKGLKSEEAWKTEYLCEKPSSHGLVLFNFEHKDASINDPDAGNFLPWKYERDLPWFALHDPSVTLTSVILCCQIWENRIFFFDECITLNCPTVSKAKQELYKLRKDKGYPIPKVVIVDPHRPDALSEWQLGTNEDGPNRKYKADRPVMNVGKSSDAFEDSLGLIEPGVELLRTLICNGLQTRRLYVNRSSCPMLSKAIQNHAYAFNASGELTSDAKPSKEFKDEIDAMRYGAIYFIQQGLLKMLGSNNNNNLKSEFL